MGLPAFARVSGIAELPNGDLVVSGTFVVGAMRCAAMRRVGGSWTPLGDEAMRAQAVALAPTGELTFAGTFALPGGRISHHVTRFLPNCAAIANTYAPGCTSSVGPVHTVVVQYPWVGTACITSTSGVPANAAVLSVLGLGAVTIPLAQVLPQALAGCSLHVTPDTTVLAGTGSGTATTSLAIPPTMSLIGQLFRQQAVVLEPGAAASGNALILGIGAL
jgi:hypothetical protein